MVPRDVPAQIHCREATRLSACVDEAELPEVWIAGRCYTTGNPRGGLNVIQEITDCRIDR